MRALPDMVTSLFSRPWLKPDEEADIDTNLDDLEWEQQTNPEEKCWTYSGDKAGAKYVVQVGNNTNIMGHER